MGRALDITELVGPTDKLADFVTKTYMELEGYRNQWMSEKRELRDYLFATDTRTTSNSSLPWKNSVHIPKLCQIRDNLQANYMSALFPNDQAIKWEGDDEDSDAKNKRMAIEAYMSNKLRMSSFRNEVQRSLLDWIDYGNAVARVVFDNETYTNELGEQTTVYVGPRMVRVPISDIVFDPTATSFAKSPKIIRTLKNLSTIAAEVADNPESAYMQAALDRAKKIRAKMAGYTQGDTAKNQGYQMDGFGSWWNYFLQGDVVEVLEYFGDIWDGTTYEKNQHITIIDRAWVINKQTHPTWLGSAPIFHVGWRLRPDNLYAMGPLDNLVGMQYRIDHLENAKSDAYDLIVYPVMKIRGYVEDFDYGPGARIITDEDGDVGFMSPDVTMLSADTQIQLYEAKMEEMAGAPKQAMGFRSPGEKTAYEVQVLENGANRVFLNKSSYFEEMFLEPILNAMLETARRNMGTSDLIRVMDDQYGIAEFLNITREDIVARGKIRPVAARHFARNANILQNLTQLAGSALGQDTAVSNHISGKGVALLIEQLLGLEKFQLVQDNVRIAEAMESQQLLQAGQQILGERQQANESISGVVPGPQPSGAGPV